jgi:hypothetical protein
MYRILVCVILILLTGTLPVTAQTVTPMPLTETYTTTMGDGLTFQYPRGWYVLESVESIIIADSETTYTQFRTNPQAAVEAGMVAISILRPQTLRLGFALDEDATLDDLVRVVSTQLQGITPESIELGDYAAYRFQYPPQRFDTVAFAFETDGLYFATLAVATDTLPIYEPTAHGIFASFAVVDESVRDLPEIEVDSTLVSELYTPLIAPLTFEYPLGWTISESQYGAVQLSNSTEIGNVFDAPVTGIVRLQITFTETNELPLGVGSADARSVLQFLISAEEAVLSLAEPYGAISEFTVGGYIAARADSAGQTGELMLIVVKAGDWFVAFRTAAFADEMIDFEPSIMAMVASLILIPDFEVTPEVTATSRP